MQPVTTMSTQRGLTLVELLMTVALLSVLISTAVPNLTRFLRSSSATAQANEINAFLGLARTEALQRFDTALVQPSGADWTDGEWLTGVDTNSNGTLADDEVLHRMTPLDTTAFTMVDSGGNALTELSFNPNGWPPAGVVIDFRKEDCRRIVTLRPTGHIGVEKQGGC